MELGQRKFPDVVPVSEDLAKHAKGTAPSEQDLKHDDALERASKIKDDEVHDLGSKEISAKYKIEVYFGPKRTHNGPNIVKISFWESGRRLHGGGDDLMYMCRDVDDEKLGCGGIFTSDLVKGPVAICPFCKKAVYAEKCTRGLVGKKTTMDLAKELAKFWLQLESNADIYCKFDRDDVRYLAIEKQMGSQKARELRGLSIYPLRNILADTANGADVVKRFYAFLTA